MLIFRTCAALIPWPGEAHELCVFIANQTMAFKAQQIKALGQMQLLH